MDIEYYFLCTVYDVSAQSNCNIISTNLTTLTIRNNLGALIVLDCQCMNGSMITTGARWFYNENLVPTTQGNTQDDTQGNKITKAMILIVLTLV